MSNATFFCRTAAAGAILIATATLGLGSPVVVDQNSDVTLVFNGFYGSSEIAIPGLTGSARLFGVSLTPALVSGNHATRVDFSYLVTNTSANPVWTSRISNIALNTSPNIIAGAPNSVSGVFNTVVIGANQPNGVGVVEFCFTASGCPGGGRGGVTQGNSGAGTASIYVLGTVSSVTIDNAYIRYQSVTCAPGSPCHGSASGEMSDGAVPEPGTYVLMIAGLAGVAAAKRMRRS